MSVVTRPVAAGPPAVPIARADIRAVGADDTKELLENLYECRLAQFRPADDVTGEVAVTSVNAGGMRADRVRSSVDFRCEVPPLKWLVAYRVLAGGLRVQAADLPERRAGKGESVLSPLGATLQLDVRRNDTAVLCLPTDAVLEVAERSFGVAPDDLRFTAMAPRTPALGQQFARILRLVHDDLMSVEPAAAHPLVHRQLLNVAASAVLAVFPNTSMTSYYVPGPGAVAVKVVRRAVAFMGEHAAEPITVAQIAEAVGTGARALQYAFRRHFDTTPMLYLARIRLARAHADLQAATPDEGVTVVAIARRWGFVDSSHFSRVYRRTYGEPPSATLRR